MSTEDEFLCWLKRKEKSFIENFQFALKAWQSLELTITSKYNIVLQWLAEELPNQKSEKFEDYPFNEFKELFQYQAPSGVIKTETKIDFVLAVLNISKHFFNTMKKNNETTKQIPEILSKLMDFELLQDIYRYDNKLYAKVFGKFIKMFEAYIKTMDPEKPLNDELEFLTSVIKSFKEFAKNVSSTQDFAEAYDKNVVECLIELLLILRTYKVDIFPELLTIEEILHSETKDLDLFKRIQKKPLLHSKLLLIECSLINRRNLELFQRELLKVFFPEEMEFMESDEKNPAEQQQQQQISEALKISSYIMEVFHKHDLSFIVDGKDGLKILGNTIKSWVQAYKETHLKEVLMLLCSTLIYNPLILEQHIYQITCWMIMADKNHKSNEVMVCYENFMRILMEVFRKLSRAEKFIVNLLKTIKDWLQHNEIPKILTCNEDKKSRKRKSLAEPKESNKKPKILEDQEQELDEKDERSFDYVSMILENSQCLSGKRIYDSENSMILKASFPFLEKTWPSSSVGKSFSSIITGLMSKPSMTIWKTLIFSLQDCLKPYKEDNSLKFKENDLFYLDLHCAMLSQYFLGCKLVEQADKFLQDIENSRNQTKQILSDFGKVLLDQEEAFERPIQAFFHLSYHFCLFDLILVHYRPDGLDLNSKEIIANLHKFLTKKQWSKLKEKLADFPSSVYNNFLIKRFHLQRKQAELLLPLDEPSGEDFHLDFQKIIKVKENIPDDDDEQEQLVLLLNDENSKWFLSSLSKEDKSKLVTLMMRKMELYSKIEEDLDCIEFLTLDILENLSKILSTLKGSLTKSLLLDFKQLRQEISLKDFEKLLASYAKQVSSHEFPLTLKDNFQANDLRWFLQALEKVPAAYLRPDKKWLVCIIMMAIYQDLNHLKLEDLRDQAYNILIDLLSFGEHLAIFKYFSAEEILKILPLDKCWKFYEYLFTTIKSEEKGSEEFLKSLSKILKSFDNKFSNEFCQLLLLTIEALSNAVGHKLKHFRFYSNDFLEIYGDYVVKHFKSFQTKEDASKKHKKFVEKTLAGFPYYAKYILVKANNQKIKDKEEDPNPNPKPNQEKEGIDEDFIRLLKIYIGYSMDYKNSHAIRLLKVALSYRDQINLDQAEIEMVLNAYWRQLNEDLKTSNEIADERNLENVIKLIIENKTNEDFLLIMKNLSNSLLLMENPSSNNFENILRLLTLIAKCTFSTIKGSIFNEHFKQITMNISIRLPKNEKQQFLDSKQVIALMEAQQALIENKMIPLTLDTLDSVLVFLLTINIKKFIVDDSNIEIFHKLHLRMSELATSILKHRHLILMDRVPQFMQVFKDLLQAIVWYKSERAKSVTFTPTELDDLGDLALKLASMMSLITSYALHFKRIAPFALTFVINLMVDNKRPTTLHKKIKTHIESICYDLITICDHRVGRFILRCSNEAGRELYKTLVKDHEKYRKFKGKV